MKTFNQLIQGGFLLLVSFSLNAQISIGGYNVYYGHIHNHTAYSDGQGTPDQAYSTAKANGLNFFGLAEHSNSLDDAEWTSTQSAADANNQPGVFTTFRGFEWTTSAFGHVAVMNTATRIRTDDLTFDTFSELVAWLNTQDCFAFFNHPGDYNSAGTEFDHFSAAQVTDKIVGMEQWNKTKGFSSYYANSAGVTVNGFFSGDRMAFYDEALQRGWRIGPEGSEDNHVATWGAMTLYKTAVLAPANTRSDLTAAFKARRFFTTDDLNVAMSFKIGGSEMGSTVSPGTKTLTILLSDGNSETFSKVELLKNGNVTTSWTPGITTVSISEQLTFSNGEYYYIRAYQEGSLTSFSSPIWISSGIANVPPSVNITSPATASTYISPATITITANASDSDGTISKVEFFKGTTKLGEDTTFPYTFTWSNVLSGAYSLTAKATDNSGTTTTSSPINVAVYSQNALVTLSSVIAAGTDDAEESDAGVMYVSSSDIELVYDSYLTAGNQIVGLRFSNLLIPAGAIINSAYIQFTCDEVNTAACTLKIKGEASGNSATFSSETRNISGRATTNASAVWIPAGWGTADVSGADQRTPDITAIVQEIVNLAGFTSSSAVTVIITGTGARVAEAYEGVPASAAKLVVAFTPYPTIIPTFNPIGPLCQNSTPPPLLVSSTNTPSIQGSWFPETISTAVAGTTLYTFTPDAGQNASATTISISVLPTPVVTNSTLTQAICSGSSTNPVILTSSVGGTTFSWSASASQDVTGYTGSGTGNIPAQSISTNQSTPGVVTFTVTPVANGCAGQTVNYTVVVNPVPSAPVVGNIVQPSCSLATGSVELSGLPAGNWTISPGGIPGNTPTTIISGLISGGYKFSVSSSAGCTSALSVNAAINIQPQVPAPPAVSNPSPYCQNDAASQLTATGVGLLWYPASSSGGTGSVFAPIPSTNISGNQSHWVSQTVGGCESPRAEIVVTVNPATTPAFNTFGPYKQGAVPAALPSTSNNGISGTWSPSVISTAVVGSSAYIFTPDMGQCATPVTIQVVTAAKTPPIVTIAAPVSGTVFTAPATITVSVTATDADGTISKVEFFQGTTSIGTDNLSPYSMSWSNVPVGSYQLTAAATDNDGLVSVSQAVAVVVNPPAVIVISKLISAGNDDVEEYNSGFMLTNDRDIDLVYDSKTTGNQKAGFRFNAISIPRGAAITKAFIQFTVYEGSSGSANLLIQGQNTDNAAAFTSVKKNVSNRQKTSASIVWSPSAWTSPGVLQQSPELKTIVQEIVNRPGWTSGNSMVFIISGTGKRSAVAFETSSTGAARLYIEYANPLTKSASINTGSIFNRIPAYGKTGVLTCYPVPFTSSLNINFEPAENENLRKISIYNASGCLLKTIVHPGYILTVPMQEFQQGIYFVEVMTDQNRYVKTVIRK